MKCLTKGELQRLNERIDEIEQLAELCHPDRDADILETLYAELDQMIKTLEASRAIALKNERKLRIVGG
jgi:prefoldin subunit 5